jgi:hypothetical protein
MVLMIMYKPEEVQGEFFGKVIECGLPSEPSATGDRRAAK